MLNLYDYISDSRMFKKFELGDLLFVEYHCLLEELRTGYWTPCNYLIYILTGKKKWKDLGKEYFGGPGDAFFFRKGAYIAEQFLEEEFCSLVIFLPDDFIRKVMRNYTLRYPGKLPEDKELSVLQLEVDHILQGYFHSVLSYFPQQRPPMKELLRVKFEEFIINVFSNTQNPRLAAYFEQLCSERKASIREIMEANYTYNLNLEEFAKMTGRSLSSFHRDFKKEFDMAPARWLTQKRLQYAKLLLETTDKSINEITFDSGFENPSHFIRIFKSVYATTPLRYKQALK